MYSLMKTAFISFTSCRHTLRPWSPSVAWRNERASSVPFLHAARHCDRLHAQRIVRAHLEAPLEPFRRPPRPGGHWAVPRLLEQHRARGPLRKLEAGVCIRRHWSQLRPAPLERRIRLPERSGRRQLLLQLEKPAPRAFRQARKLEPLWQGALAHRDAGILLRQARPSLRSALDLVGISVALGH